MEFSFPLYTKITCFFMEVIPTFFPLLTQKTPHPQDNKKGTDIPCLSPKTLAVTALSGSAEITLQQTLESLAVTSLVAGHFMYGVVDGIQVQFLGFLGDGLRYKGFKVLVGDNPFPLYSF